MGNEHSNRISPGRPRLIAMVGLAVMVAGASIFVASCTGPVPIPPDPPAIRPQHRDLLVLPEPAWQPNGPTGRSAEDGAYALIAGRTFVRRSLLTDVPPADLLEQAHDAFIGGDAAEAAELFAASHHRAPLDTDDLLRLALAERQLQRYRSAESRVREAREGEPTNPEVTFWLGVLRYEQDLLADLTGQMTGMRWRDDRAAGQQLPDDPGSTHFDVETEESLHRFGAATLFQMTIDQLRSSRRSVWAPVWFNLGMCNARLYRWPQTIRAFEAYLASPIAAPGTTAHQTAVRWIAYANERLGNEVTTNRVYLRNGTDADDPARQQ